MIKVIQIGLGPIGQQLTRYLVEREGIRIVGAVDRDPDKIDTDIGELAGIGKMGVIMSGDLPTVMKKQKADVAVISTVSSLKKIEGQVEEAAGLGLDVVSTCEELVFPFHTQPETASRIDKHCKTQKVSCISTGVNPGFLMDYLPAVLSSVCRRVDHIKVKRLQDARNRRIPFQQKIGAGLSSSEFKEKEHLIRHVGLTESVHLLAYAMRWNLDRVDEILEPIVSGNTIELENMMVNKGRVAGVRQVARGYADGKELIVLEFEAAVGLEKSEDSIKIAGEPGFHSIIAGGINGDIATSAIVVNAIRQIVHAGNGLKTMLDISPPSYFSHL